MTPPGDADRLAVVLLALAAPLALLALLPPGAYDFSGHETGYLALLHGQPVEADESLRFALMPVPSVLARVLGALGAGEGVWTALNRLALGGVVFAAGRGCAALGGRGAVAAVLALLSPTLLLWSGAGYFLVPALALALGGVLAGAREKPILALVLGLLAVGTRLETAPLALLGAWLASPRPGRLALVAAGGAFALWVLLDPRLAGLTRPDLSTLRLLTAAQLVGLGAAALGLWSLGDDALPWGGALLLTLALPLGLADPGARHFLPLGALAALLAGVGVQRLPGTAGPLAAVAALLGLLGAVGVPHRWDPERQGRRPAWERAARETWSRDDLAARGCAVLAPGGDDFIPGALDSERVGSIRAVRDADCVFLVVTDGALFRGDTRSERFDRARRVLGLEPVARVPDGEALVFGAR